MSEVTSYSAKVSAEQARKLKDILAESGFAFREVPYAFFGAVKDKLNVTAYESGKLLVQGKGTREFVEFILEPQVFGEAKFGYEDVLDPTRMEPRIGVDESGKGDFFGPMVVAGVYVNKDIIEQLRFAGVRDSKQITSDTKIFQIADTIKNAKGIVFSIVAIGPEAYNRLYTKMASVNKLLGWGHARAIENILEKVDCKRAISDQFGDEKLIRNSLMQRGRQIELIQRHKAESDFAVAAASILARSEFVRRLAELGKEFNLPFPKGASNNVLMVGKEFVKQQGADKLSKVAKMHFRTCQLVQDLPAPPKKEWRKPGGKRE